MSIEFNNQEWLLHPLTEAITNRNTFRKGDDGTQNHPPRSHVVCSPIIQLAQREPSTSSDDCIIDDDDDYERRVKQISRTILLSFMSYLRPKYSRGSAQT